MKKADFLLGIVIGFLIGLFLLGGFIVEHQNYRWRNELITRGYGEYNSTNGIFQWKINILTNSYPFHFYWNGKELIAISNE